MWLHLFIQQNTSGGWTMRSTVLSTKQYVTLCPPGIVLCCQRWRESLNVRSVTRCWSQWWSWRSERGYWTEKPWFSGFWSCMAATCRATWEQSRCNRHRGRTPLSGSSTRKWRLLTQLWAVQLLSSAIQELWLTWSYTCLFHILRWKPGLEDTWSLNWSLAMCYCHWSAGCLILTGSTKPLLIYSPGPESLRTSACMCHLWVSSTGVQSSRSLGWPAGRCHHLTRLTSTAWAALTSELRLWPLRAAWLACRRLGRHSSAMRVFSHHTRLTAVRSHWETTPTCLGPRSSQWTRWLSPTPRKTWPEACAIAVPRPTSVVRWL